MAEVIFYEKAGCAANARQKALLVASGHQLVVRDLRGQFWSNVRLLEFLAGLPVAQWFNPAAPAIKEGTIVPHQLDEPSALALLRHDPLLIRRPLLQVGEERRVGFDVAAIDPTWTNDVHRCVIAGDTQRRSSHARLSSITGVLADLPDEKFRKSKMWPVLSM